MMMDGIEGYLIGSDVYFLREKASKLPVGGSYLEIGSWMGLSAVIVSKELKRLGNVTAKVYCVDTWKGSEEHQELDVIKNDELFDRFKSNIERSGMADMIISIRKPSVQVAQEWAGSLLDQIFIDGDHTFDGCANDIRAWIKWLRPGGDIYGHDATDGSPVMRAAKAVAEELGKSVVFFDPPIAHYVWQYT
jgi:predicted O-methyltransferase YrrM